MMRVYQLSKQLDIPNGELIELCEMLNIEVKTASSGLTPEQVDEIIEAATGEAPELLPTMMESEEAPATEAEEAPASEDSEDDSNTADATDAEEAPPPEAASSEDEPSSEEAEEEDDGKPIRIELKGSSVKVKDFAEMIHLKPNQVIAQLMTMNIFASINQEIDIKIAQKIAKAHGYKVHTEQKKKVKAPAPIKKKDKEPKKPKAKKATKDGKDAPAALQDKSLSRPPVVTFLGHVDHGKTSVLDRIRNSRVVKGEAGGITQHIGAYTVDQDGKAITFLDTPGHEAFTQMRARGANLTDIAVIVIASDEGIMPQTKEAIQHAQAAEVTIMIALNKIDLPGSNLDRVKQQLQQMDLTPEDWGGEVACVPVSAETGEGFDALLERIMLEAEMLELQANPADTATGYVIEAQLESGRGPTATLLVCGGTLSEGDALICGDCWGRVKALMDYRGKKVKAAGPSHAVRVMGLSDVPEAGAKFEVYKNEREARRISEERLNTKRREELEAGSSLAARNKPTLDDLFAQAGLSDERKELTLVLKADVQGSLEAIQQSLLEIPSDKVSLKFVLAGVGNISENDILLASASNAIVLGFNVSNDNASVRVARREGVDIRLYAIIYEMIDEVRTAMTGLLDATNRETISGRAEIRQIFKLDKQGNVAGCMVIEGRVNARNLARVMRGRDVIYTGRISSLKRFQNEAAEVRDGQECGIRLENFSKFEEKDIIETYEIEKVAQVL